MSFVSLHKSWLAEALVALFVGVCMVGPSAAASNGKVYRYLDNRGTVHFSDYPRTGKFQVMLWSLKQQSGIINKTIIRLAKQYKVPAALVRAVIHAESSYRPEAISPAGAMGLMQLMPETAAELKVVNPLAIEDNLRGGISYLHKMLARFDGNTRLALAAYNAGPSAVRKHNGVPPFPETQKYVKKVLALQIYYEAQKGL